MILITSLWLPILLSAVFVFIISSIIHTVLNYHSTDFGKVPKEEEVMEALGKFDIPPGDYVVPYAGSVKETKSPEYIEKVKKEERRARSEIASKKREIERLKDKLKELEE